MEKMTDVIRKGSRHWAERKTSRTTLLRAQQGDEAALKELAAFAAPYLLARAVEEKGSVEEGFEVAAQFLTRMLAGAYLRNVDLAKGKYQLYLGRCLCHFACGNVRRAEESLDRLLEEEMDFPAREVPSGEEGDAPPVEEQAHEVVEEARGLASRFPGAVDAALLWEGRRTKGKRPPMSVAAHGQGVSTRRFEQLVKLGRRYLLMAVRRRCRGEEDRCGSPE